METTFIEHSKKGQDQTSVWYHFLIGKHGNVAKCKQCSRQIKCIGGSTSGLHTHLKTIHGLNLKMMTNGKSPPDIDIEQSYPQKKPKLLITNHHFKNKNDKLVEIIARMVANDGLSFNHFINSYDIREGLNARGYKDLPNSVATIRNMILEYGEFIKQNTVAEITKLKLDGKRFSISMDEWISIRNRRYINVNVHSIGPALYNIGLIRAHRSLSAVRCLSLVTEKLKDFNIDINKDIVGVTTDGASSLMVKFGKLIAAEHQQCLVHCINLAIADVFYKSRPIVDTVVEQNDDADADYDDDDDINNETDDEDNDGIIIEIDSTTTTNDIIDISHENISCLLAKIRKVIKIFKKNDRLLQKYVQEQLGREVTLKLDCKTRWNTMLSMLEKFNEIKFCIQQSLIDIGSDIYFCEDEFNLLSAIIAALTPIKLTIDALISRQDSNLLTADASIAFMLDELSTQNSSISFELIEALKFRIHKHRNAEISDILQYLQKGTQQQQDGLIFNRISKSMIIKKIASLIERMNNENSENVVKDEHDEDYGIFPPPIITTQIIDETTVLNNQLNVSELKKKLDAAINRTMNPSIPIINKNNILEQKIHEEMIFFEKTGIKGSYLQNAYNLLMTILPTSVDSGRAFTAAGLFCTKIRSSFDDQTIDCLCFLRTYFNNNKQSANAQM